MTALFANESKPLTAGNGAVNRASVNARATDPTTPAEFARLQSYWHSLAQVSAVVDFEQSRENNAVLG